MFQKINFENVKKLQNIVVFYIKISSQNKEPPPLSKQSPFSSTSPFQEEIFHLHPYCQIRGSQSLPL